MIKDGKLHPTKSAVFHVIVHHLFEGPRTRSCGCAHLFWRQAPGRRLMSESARVIFCEPKTRLNRDWGDGWIEKAPQQRWFVVFRKKRTGLDSSGVLHPKSRSTSLQLSNLTPPAVRSPKWSSHTRTRPCTRGWGHLPWKTNGARKGSAKCAK